MPTDVIMPQMGESIFEGTLTKWLKKPGDRVQRDEPLFEISTDKVDAEIPAPASGVLKEVKVAEGATVQVNTVVGVIDAEGSAVAAAPAAKAPEPAKTAGATRGGAASTDGEKTAKPAQAAKREDAQRAAPPAQPSAQQKPAPPVQPQAQQKPAPPAQPPAQQKPAAPAPAAGGGPGTDVIMPQMGE